MDAVIWHNPRCSKSRGARQLLDDHGVDVHEVRYLDDAPDRAALEDVLRKLGTDDPSTITRTAEPRFRELGLAGADRDTLLDALAANPVLIERPIVVVGDRAVLARPPELLLELLDRTTPRVDPSNAGAAQGWDGPAGDFWTDNADMFDAGVARYLQPFLAAAAIEPGSHVLDVGCGTGQTTREAARLASAGSATGVDLSARMLDLARRRAADEGLGNVSFVQADAQIADLGRYDRVVSRTGVMFFGDPVAAFANLARALRPDGRMVLAVWQPFAENEWLGAFLGAVAMGRDLPPPPPDGPGPFALGDPDRVRALLAASGFGEPELVGLREPMYFGPDVATAERMALGVVGGLLADLDDATRAQAQAALRASLLAHLGPDGVTYRSAMWIITARHA